MDLPTTIPLAAVRPSPQQPSAASTAAVNSAVATSTMAAAASLSLQQHQINATANAVVNATAAQLAAIQNVLAAQSGAATNSAIARQHLGYATAPSTGHAPSAVSSASASAAAAAAAALHPYHPLPLELIYQPSFVFPTPQHQTAAAAAAAALAPCLLTAQAVCQTCAFSSPSQPCIHHAPIPYGQASSYAAVAAVAAAANSQQISATIPHQHLTVAATTTPQSFSQAQQQAILNQHAHLASGSTGMSNYHRDEAIRADLESARQHSYLPPVGIRAFRIKRSAVAAALNRSSQGGSSNGNSSSQGSNGDGCTRPVAKLRRVASDSGREMQAFQQSELIEPPHPASDSLPGHSSGSSGNSSASSSLQVVTGPVVTSPSNSANQATALAITCSLCSSAAAPSISQVQQAFAVQQPGSSSSLRASSTIPGTNNPVNAIIPPTPLTPTCTALHPHHHFASTAAVHQSTAQAQIPPSGSLQPCSPCVCAYCPHGSASAAAAAAASAAQQAGLTVPVQAVTAHQLASSNSAVAQQSLAGIQIVPTDPTAALARLAAANPANIRQQILSTQHLTPHGPTRLYHSIILNGNSLTSHQTNRLLEYSMFIMPTDALNNLGERTLDRHHMFTAAPNTEPQPVGATPQDIEKCTEKIQFVKDIEIPESETERCVVCLDAFESGEEVRTLKCTHLFHVNCIDKWLVYNKKCPVCRLDVDKHNGLIVE